MRELLINRIIKAKDRIFMEDDYRAYTYRQLAFEILNLSTMIDTLKIPNPRICLSASNSFEWVVVFLTALIKSIPVYLVPQSFTAEHKYTITTRYNLNLLFVSDSDEQKGHMMSTNNFTCALIRMSTVEGYVLDYVNPFRIKNIEKKRNKWVRLNAIDHREIKNGAILLDLISKNINHTYKNCNLWLFTSGVNSHPELKMIFPETMRRTVRGMSTKLEELNLKKCSFSIETDLNWFVLQTLLPIIVLEGTVVLTRHQANGEKIGAIFANTNWFEEMWDYVAIGQTEKQRRQFEKWLLTKWINTIRLKKEFKAEFGGTDKIFIILNDETHFKLKKNLQRIGYKVISTYGTTKFQLISIDEKLIQGVNIKLDAHKPGPWPAELQVTEKFGGLDQFRTTGDMAIMGPNSELQILGRKDDRIYSANGSMYNPNKIERIVRSDEFIKQALLIQYDNKIVLLIRFKTFIMDALAKTSADVVKMAKEIKDNINSYLPEEEQIDGVTSYPKPLDVNEQGKIIRHFYNDTPVDSA